MRASDRSGPNTAFGKGPSRREDHSVGAALLPERRQQVKGGVRGTSDFGPHGQFAECPLCADIVAKVFLG